MHRIKKDSIHFKFDRKQEPVLNITPGDIVSFEIQDACCGEVCNVEQFHDYRNQNKKSGPLCGPVYIEGAKPGDVLLVEIIKIELGESGFQLIGPDRAIIENEIEEWTFYKVKTENGMIMLPNNIKVNAEPVVGTLGNAPSGESTACENRLGGNLDIPSIKTGSKVYLPVEVHGALFSIGDVHACQGDGEVVGAPEISAVVTVRLSLTDKRNIERVMIEKDGNWYTPFFEESEYKSARSAVLYNAHFISKEFGIELKDALVLLTMTGQLTISRTGKWGPYKPVVCSSFSEIVVKNAIKDYSAFEKK